MAMRWDFSPILIVMVFLLHNLLISGATDSPTTGLSLNDFIRNNCNQTRYPDICYASLSGHKNAIKENNLERLAFTALYVSRDVAKGAVTQISDLSAEKGSDVSGGVAEVFGDCFSSFKSATRLIGDSMKQMKKVMANKSSNQEAFVLQMGNVQTWTSAALTDEDTCLNSFKEANGGMFSAVVEDSKKVTSNALALVNLYISSKN